MKTETQTGGFRPHTHYPPGWQHNGEKWKTRARQDRATHCGARGKTKGNLQRWDKIADSEKRKTGEVQRAKREPGPSTNRPTTTATATAAPDTTRERNKTSVAQRQPIPRGEDGSGTLPREEGRGEPAVVK